MFVSLFLTMSLARNPIAQDLDWIYLTLYKDAIFQITETDTKVSIDTMFIVTRGVYVS